MMAPVPKWAQATALALVALTIAMLVWGRGGTWVLAAAAAAFGAVAILLLSQPEEEPGEESG